MRHLAYCGSVGSDGLLRVAGLLDQMAGNDAVDDAEHAANQPFGEWGKIFPDPAMTLAAVDRLVHHATIFELNVDSYRRRTAIETKRGRGRPATRATIKNTDTASRPDNQDHQETCKTDQNP